MNNWVKQAVFYQIYPLGFCGAPTQHQQEVTHSLLKLKEWIPHLQKMHINAVYLGPVFESYEHGYDTSDYRLIDHRLGTNEDFKDICTALHEAGIRIVLDGVFNHVGRAFWAFEDVIRNRENSVYCGWFHNLNFQSNNPMNDGFSYDTWEGYHNLVKLNLRNEEVVQYLLESIQMWMEEFHIDGLRLDAADCVDADFFRRMKTFCKAKNADFWLMGEIIHGDYTRWANPEMLDSVTNYECYKGVYSAHNDKNYFEIAHSLQRQFGKGGIYQNLILYNFGDNHDVNRLASVVKHKQDLFNIYTLLFTMPGIPSIYYGSEWAIEGIKHDGSDADIRPCLELATMQQMDNTLCEHLSRLSELHQKFSCFHGGIYEQLIVRNEQFVFFRKLNDQILYVALNVSDEDVDISWSVPSKQMDDILNHVTYTCQNHELHVALPAKSAGIFIPGETKSNPEENVQSDCSNIMDNTLVENTTTITEELMDETSTATVKPVHHMLDELALGIYCDNKDQHVTLLYTGLHEDNNMTYAIYRELFNEERILLLPVDIFRKEYKFLKK